MQLLPNVSLIEQTDCYLKVKIDDRQLSQTASVSVEQLGIECEFTNLDDLIITGEYHFNGVRYIEIALPLPSIPIGYYHADITVGEQHASTEIWSVPERVFQVEDTKKTGLSVQLYTLKNNDCCDLNSTPSPAHPTAKSLIRPIAIPPFIHRS